MRRIINITILSILAIGILYSFFLLWKKYQPEKISYEIVEAKRRNIDRISVITGTIHPREEVEIKPQMSGIIREIYVKPGDEVKEGDIIARIGVEPITLSTAYAEFQLKMARVSLNQQKRLYDRAYSLHMSEIISSSEMEKINNLYENSKEELFRAQENLEITRYGKASGKEKYNYTLVKSTVKGTVLDVPVKKGNTVIMANIYNPGTTIATVGNIGNMVFTGHIDETEINNFQPGKLVKLSIKALQKDNIIGFVDYISPKSIDKDGSVFFEIKILVDMPEDVILRTGYRANAAITLSRRRNVLAIPEHAISFENNSTFVYIFQENENGQSFVKKHVILGLSDKRYIEILSGLKENQQVRGAVIKSK